MGLPIRLQARDPLITEGTIFFTQDRMEEEIRETWFVRAPNRVTKPPFTVPIRYLGLIQGRAVIKGGRREIAINPRVMLIREIGWYTEMDGHTPVYLLGEDYSFWMHIHPLARLIQREQGFMI